MRRAARHAATTATSPNRAAATPPSIFLIGWATGGLIFGILGDRIGRARTMMLTILLYSLFTGLSAFSVGFWDFAFYRFLTGLGVGGEFAVGVSLVAEVMPDRARPFALGLLQALSAVGNITAALVGIVLAYPGAGAEVIDASRGGSCSWSAPCRPCWRPVIMRRLKEPERWRQLAAEDEHRRAARRLLRANCSATRAGRGTPSSACCWPPPASSACGRIGFFSIDLHARRSSARTPARRRGFARRGRRASSEDLLGRHDFDDAQRRRLLRHLRLQLGHRTASAAGRPSPISFVLALLSTACVFWQLNSYRRHLLDDPDHGLLPAGAVRRLRHLLPGTVPDPPAQHRNLVLLQRRAASSPPPARRAGPVLTSDVFGRLRADDAAALRRRDHVRHLPASAWSSCPSPRKPRASRCRSEVALRCPCPTPDWLTHHGGELRANPDGQSYVVYFGGEPQYVLRPSPVRGKFGCHVTQTINGKRLESGAAHPTAGRRRPRRTRRPAQGLGWWTVAADVADSATPTNCCFSPCWRCTCCRCGPSAASPRRTARPISKTPSSSAITDRPDRPLLRELLHPQHRFRPQLVRTPGPGRPDAPSCRRSSPRKCC